MQVQQVGQLAVRREAALLQERAHGAVLHEEVLPAQHALEVRVGNAQPRERVGQAGGGGNGGAGGSASGTPRARAGGGGSSGLVLIHGRSFPGL